MDQQEMIRQIVEMLDESAQKGVGHMNVTIDDANNNPDCNSGNFACCVPTLHEGMDNEEE